MVVPYANPCYHCDQFGHYKKECPWLTEPEGKAEHEARFAEIMRQWNAQEITTHAKHRMIAKENDLWKAKLARMRKAAKAG